MIHASRAIGVRRRRDGQAVDARAARPVILAAGSIATPAILRRSGMGPTPRARRRQPTRRRRPRPADHDPRQPRRTGTALTWRADDLDDRAATRSSATHAPHPQTARRQRWLPSSEARRPTSDTTRPIHTGRTRSDRRERPPQPGPTAGRRRRRGHQPRTAARSVASGPQRRAHRPHRRVGRHPRRLCGVPGDRGARPHLVGGRGSLVLRDPRHAQPHVRHPAVGRRPRHRRRSRSRHPVGRVPLPVGDRQAGHHRLGDARRRSRARAGRGRRARRYRWQQHADRRRHLGRPRPARRHQLVGVQTWPCCAAKREAICNSAARA